MANSEPKKTVHLIIDTESVPDGRLIARVKYPNERLTPEEAVLKAQAEARDKSGSGSDFLPVSFQYPVAVSVLVVEDYAVKGIRCLDSPSYRPRQIVESFWSIPDVYHKKNQPIQLVTFNGRGFDLPLLEMAAFRFGVRCGNDYLANIRKRFDFRHLDLLEWITNFGACRSQGTGGLNLFSKLLGKPGKMGVSGDQVYEMYQAGKLKEINEYCTFDTLDTYFVFLRTRVMTGELSLEKEREVVRQTRDWIASKTGDIPALQQYLDNWGDWEPWP
jgi:predicted PolB exonuclease-like 3'-5' exonuclease